MKLDKKAYVKEFIQKLHAHTHIPQANNIQYDETKTLAGALESELTNYDYVIMHSLTDSYPDTINNAYNMITAAFTHGVIINKHDLRTQLRQTEELLTRCEDDKVRLEKDNNELRQELIRCQKLNEGLEELLSKYDNNDNGV